MTDTFAFARPSEDGVEPDFAAMLLAEHLRDLIWTVAHTSPRSLQHAVGASEIGSMCARQVGYKAAGVPGFDRSDPLRALMGNGFHKVMADGVERIDGGARRYLVETPITLDDVPGTADLLDRRRKVLVDWKTSTLSRIKEYRRAGFPDKYRVQVMVYGTALVARGEEIDDVALCFVPVDSTLSDIYVWRAPLDTELAKEAVEAYHVIAETAVQAGPGELPANPSSLCKWCDHHVPGSTDLSIGCPGQSAEEKSQ